MDSEINLNQIINNNPHEVQLSGRPKNRMWNCVQKINRCKFKNWKGRANTELNKWRSALECRAIEGGGGEEGEEGEEEEEKEEKEK